MTADCEHDWKTQVPSWVNNVEKCGKCGSQRILLPKTSAGDSDTWAVYPPLSTKGGTDE